ncbi:MAG TPA: PHP domain-containing protein [Gemmataceae bacterium]|nr:PHP domain-containing protein [Gemmataceae bacterium]
MAARQPFTNLCQQLARRSRDARVDLHIHTTFSDGTYTPAQVVDLAVRSGLPALAITDHDTIAGIEPARKAAGEKLEVIAGVEITCQFQDEPFHLLGYFFRQDDVALTSLLKQIRDHRKERFLEMVERLGQQGIKLNVDEAAENGRTFGRRHLAEMLVNAGRAGTVREAFLRHLRDDGPVMVPHLAIPVADAIAVVRGAGGVAAWAHPPYDCTREALLVLREMGLQAVEVQYPSCRPGRSRELRAWAKEAGLAITGGSDCHGPGNGLHSVGSGGVTSEELENVRELARC